MKRRELAPLAALAFVACQDATAPTTPPVELLDISAAVVAADGFVVEEFARAVQPVNQQGPTALAFDSQGNLYVATGGLLPGQSALKILKIPAGDNVPQGFGVAIFDPDGVAVDSEDNIIVSGIPVTKFNPAGTVIWQRDCPIRNIQLVTVDADDNIYVGSLGTRICKISPDGFSVTTFGDYDQPSEPAVSPDGFLYIAQAGKIIKVSLADGEIGEVLDDDVASGAFSQPAFAPSGDLFVGSTGGTVKKISIPDGGFTTVASGFTFPRGLAFAPDGTLFVADGIDKVIYKIQKIQSTPEQQVQALIHDIAALVEAGWLNEGNANALTATLNNALKSLEKGRKNASNLLRVFIKKVRAYMARGILTHEQGQPLIDAAQEVIDQLSP